MKNLKFFLSIIVVVFFFSQTTVFSMEDSEGLSFEIEDRNSRRFILRPIDYEGDKDGVKALIETHTKSVKTHVGTHTKFVGMHGFLLADPTESDYEILCESWEKKYIKEECHCSPIRKRWVLINILDNSLVGDFNFDNTSVAILVHPDLCGSGLGSRVRNVVLEYLTKQLGAPDFEVGLENAKDYEELPKSYEEYKKLVSPQQIVYEGFLAQVNFCNVASLRVFLTEPKMSISQVRAPCFFFSFPSKPEDPSLRVLAKQLASKDENEVEMARKQFQELYFSLY